MSQQFFILLTLLFAFHVLAVPYAKPSLSPTPEPTAILEWAAPSDWYYDPSKMAVSSHQTHFGKTPEPFALAQPSQTFAPTTTPVPVASPAAMDDPELILVPETNLSANNDDDFGDDDLDEEFNPEDGKFPPEVNEGIVVDVSSTTESEETLEPSPERIMLSAIVPSSIGATLGTVTVETSAFETLCKSCCSSTKSKFQGSIPILASCSGCSLNKNASPSSSCPKGSKLGSTNSPTSCFYTRCRDMLAGSCFCFSR